MNKKKNDPSLNFLKSNEKRLLNRIESFAENIQHLTKNIDIASNEMQEWKLLKEDFLKLRETYPKLELINAYSVISAEFLNKEKFSIDPKEKFLMELDPYGPILAIKRYSLVKLGSKSVRIYKDADYISMFTIDQGNYHRPKNAYPWKVKYNKHWENLLKHQKSKKIIKYLIDFDANQSDYSLSITWENVPARIQKLMNFS